MDNATDFNVGFSPDSEKYCIDRDGREIANGFIYTPGPDACQVCTCVSGSPGACQTVLCAPPSNCQSFRLKDRCCEWLCLDDIRTGEDDIGLRLVACGVTAILSLALLFFLIYRLRQRKMREHAAAAAAGTSNEAGGMGPGDQGSVDSVTMTNFSGYPLADGEGSGRGYMYGWMWWKPHEEFVCPPPPPAYDDAVANDSRIDYYGGEDDRGSNGSNSGGSDAPSYNQIHRDLVLQTYHQPSTSLSRTVTPNPPIPAGATLVLPQPAPPISDLHHVDRPGTSHSSHSGSPEHVGPSSRSRRLTPTHHASDWQTHDVSASGHRTLPSSSRRAGAGSSRLHQDAAARLSVPNQRTFSSSASLNHNASVDV